MINFSRYKLFYSNKALRALILAEGLILIAYAMIGPIYALLVTEIGGSILDAGLTGGFLVLASGVTVLIAGKFADKVSNPKIFLVSGYTLTGIAFLLYLAVFNIWSLFLVQIFAGLVRPISSPAFDRLYSEHLDKGELGREWSVWESSYYFATGIGAIVGGLIVSQFGFRPIFIIMAAISFAAAAYIYYLPKRLL
jgi:MFS family permease